MLRAVLIAAGVILTAATFLFSIFDHHAWPFFVWSGLITAAFIFERWRYERKKGPLDGWEKTEERFEDPANGRIMRVYYHRKTGERRYEPE